MTISYTTSTLNAMLSGSGLNATIGAAAILRIYAGTIPADANAALGSPTTLVDVTLASPLAFNSASGGTMSLIQVPAVTVVTTGTPSFFRILQSGGSVTVVQGTAGPEGTPVTYDLPLPILSTGSQLISGIALQLGSLTLGF